MERIRHFLSLKDFNRDQIENLLRLSEKMEPIAVQKKKLDLLKEKVMAALFFQPSTRTRLSFETAMIRLGGSVIGFADIEQSRAGGVTQESLKDTALVIQEYADVIVIRDARDFAPAELARYAQVPVINGGDGGNEHPTQGLLDLYTIQREFGHIDDLNVLIWSMMTYRVVHSFLYGLAKYRNVKVYLYSPGELKMPEHFIKDYAEIGLFCREVKSYEEVIGDIDVFYVNPIRRGRDVVTEKKFVLDSEKLKKAKKKAIVLHPLPRTDELPEDVDDTPHARYFAQSRNGVAVRMALLSYVFGLKV